MKNNLSEFKNIAILRINKLAIDVSIGIYDYEKFMRSVFVSISAHIPAKFAEPQNDEITEVVNYEELANAAIRAVKKDHTNLLETLCHKIADECFEIPQVLAVQVCVEKIGAIKNLESVSVEIFRNRLQ